MFERKRSECYKFTVKTLDDPKVAELKYQLKLRNQHLKKCVAYFNKLGIDYPQPRMKAISIKRRGSRKLNGVVHHYTTPKENATHYDVYYRYIY